MQRLGVLVAHLTQPCQPSPEGSPGRPAHRPFRGLLGVHSRCGLHTRAVTVFRDPLSEGFRHFVTSMPAPVASGWSGRRVGVAPTGKRRLSTAHTLSGPSRWSGTWQTQIGGRVACPDANGEVPLIPYPFPWRLAHLFVFRSVSLSISRRTGQMGQFPGHVHGAVQALSPPRPEPRRNPSLREMELGSDPA